MHPLLEDAAQRASVYLDGLPTRAVAALPAAVAHLQTLDEPLPEHPLAPHDVLRQLDNIGSPATAAMAGGRFFGFVIGGALPVSMPPTGWPRRGTRTLRCMAHAGCCGL